MTLLNLKFIKVGGGGSPNPKFFWLFGGLLFNSGHKDIDRDGAKP